MKAKYYLNLRKLDSFITDIFTFKKANHQTKVVKEIV